MTRERRLIVILLAIGGAGIAALVLLARQIGTPAPQRSVRDLPPPGATAPMPDVAAGDAARPPAASADTPVHRVEGFVAARKAVSAVVARYPVKFKQIAAAYSGNFDSVKGERAGLDFDAMGAYKIARYEALTSAGMSEPDYETVRAAWRAWKSGAGADPALAAAFEARRQDLASCDLGPTEAFDDSVK